MVDFATEKPQNMVNTQYAAKINGTNFPFQFRENKYMLATRITGNWPVILYSAFSQVIVRSDSNEITAVTK